MPSDTCTTDHRQRSFLLALTGLIVASQLGWAAEPNQVTVERGVAAKMRDGVVLRADIYRPSAEGRFPVLLQRTPYNKNGDAEFGQKAAARGYVAIIQDVRGRYTSDGEFDVFRHESDDGFDTVEWAAALPYSDGKVGMFGGSYVGATQMLAAIAHPPHLAGICPYVTASNYHDGWTWQGGAFEQWFNESWTSHLAQDTLNRLTQKSMNALEGDLKLPLAEYAAFNLPPVSTGAGLTGLLAPYFADWLAHPNYDDYWKRLSIEDHFAEINVPALHIAAWYDIFQGGSLRNYMGIKARGGSEAARRGQRLLVAIGGHAGGGRKIGEVDFGPAAAEFDENDVVLRWYDFLFKGERNNFATEKPVKLFVMGTNEWREEDDWPLARARSTKYFLHSRSGANSLGGDGTLSTSAPGSESPDRYVYDPADPAPTVGGPLCCDAPHLAPGPRDQRPVENRKDVLVYTTPPFSEDVEITGPVSVQLYAKSSAVDTDFTAKLVDVSPNGFAQNLTEGIQRARYRDSAEKPELMRPDQVYKFTVDLWSTSNVFRKGHAMRLEISSSNFPRFDRNLNTGEDVKLATKFVRATNTILHDAAHASVLTVPVVPAR